MKKLHVIPLLFLIILTAMGLGGCMNRKEQVETAIQAYYLERYQKNITIAELYDEFSGDKGNYYRAVCRSEGYDEPFIVMLFPNPEENLPVSIDGTLYSIEDEYPNLLIQNELAVRMTALLDQPVMVRCRLETDRNFTDEELAMGADACLRLDGTDPFIRYYVLLRSGSDTEAQELALRMAISSNLIGDQVLFLGIGSGSNPTEWIECYLENYDNFDYYITHTSSAQDVVKLIFRADAKKE